MKITRKMLVISIIFIFALTHYSKSLFTCLIRDFVFAIFSWFFVNILDFQNGRKTTKIRKIDFLLIYWIFKLTKTKKINEKKSTRNRIFGEFIGFWKSTRNDKIPRNWFFMNYQILKIDENILNWVHCKKKRGKKSAKTNFFRRFVIPFSDFWTKIGHFA